VGRLEESKQFAIGVTGFPPQALQARAALTNGFALTSIITNRLQSP
jgi:hypothetical protein